MIRRWLAAAALVLLATGAGAQNKPVPTGAARAAPAPAAMATVDKTLTVIPQGRGMPIMIRVGLTFIELKGINENEGSFTATVDMRVRWQDLRLQFARTAGSTGYQEWNGEEAKQKMAEIWTPQLEYGNLKGEPTYSKRGLRIYADGTVEYMQRTAGTFNADYSLENFPFDRQKLSVEMISRIEPLQRVLLDFRQDELEFSNNDNGNKLDGWSLGLVELSKDSVQAWRGEHNSRVKASLVVKRDQPSLLATIFVPLVASLLIPLLVLWLNKYQDGEFAVDAFELTNISIGGLFAVVALNFTVNSSFVQLASGDNPVMRLFALNYFMLALSIAVGILLYQFNLVRRWFGTHVQAEFYAFICWAVPVLAFGTAAAMVLMAVF
jgi:uncharacterized Tic20 family protein